MSEELKPPNALQPVDLLYSPTEWKGWQDKDTVRVQVWRLCGTNWRETEAFGVKKS